jgi:hypothetical protein
MQDKRISSRSIRSMLASTLPSFRSKTLTEAEPQDSKTEEGKQRVPTRRSTGTVTPFRRGTIRRVDTELKRVDPSGRISREPSMQQPPPEIFFEPTEEFNGSHDNMKDAPPVLVESPKSAPAALEDGRQSILSEDVNAQEEWKEPISTVSPSPGDALVASPPVEPSALPATPLRSPRMVGFDVPKPANTPNPLELSRTRTSNLRQRRRASAPQRSKTWSEIEIRAFLSYR